MESNEYDFRADEDRFENPANQASALAGLPLLLIALALVIWFSFQLSQTLKARDNLIQTFNNQETSVQNSKKVQQSLAALAMGTKQLAAQGNGNAAQIVTALSKRGVKIADPQANPAQPK